VAAVTGDWKLTTLGDLAVFRNGINFTASEFGSGLPIINVADFGSRTRPDYDSLREISADAPVGVDSILRDGDIVAVRSNGNRDLIGRTMLVRNPPEITHSAFTIRIRLHDAGRKKVTPEFLAFLLRGPSLRAALSAHGSGTNISNLNQRILERLPVVIPSLRIQKKIVAILGAYDDLVENDRRRIQLLEEMAQRIYREWFVDLRFAGHTQPAGVDVTAGAVPQGWSPARIGDVVETVGGGTPSRREPAYWKDGDVVWYTPSDLTASKSVFMRTSKAAITPLGLARSAARLFPAGSVMMTSRATIGVVAIAATEACTNQGFITCIPTEQISTYHLYFWLREKRETIDTLASGATFKEISRSEFRDLTILVPPVAIERRFVETVRPLFDLIGGLEAAIGIARRTRDLLLPRLVTGDVDVDRLNIPVEERPG
jgi:type I restriction enzyme, S subunit